MKKEIAVKKNINHIYVTRWMSALFLLTAVFILTVLRENAGYAMLICGIFLLPVLMLEIYYETWSISFGEKICRRIFFFTHTYEWREMKEAEKYYSLSQNGETVKLIFLNGKSIVFCLKDQNAEKAERVILTHCNIKQT